MRVKITLLLIAVVLVISVVNFGSSLMFTRKTLLDTMSHDISLACDFIDEYISMKIKLLESDASTLAERLEKADSGQAMNELMSEQLPLYPDFMAFTVFSRDDVIASYGDSPTLKEFLGESRYIQYAFNGGTAFSTTRIDSNTGKLVFHICTPMGKDHVLSVTVPGMIFSQLFTGKKIYKTGHVFMFDEEGVLIADYHTDLQEHTNSHCCEDLIYTRTTYLDIPIMENIYDSLHFDTLMPGSVEVGNYVSGDKEYFCAYMRVSSSTTGWIVALSVPASESPAANVQNRLIIQAIAFIFLGIIVAVIISGLLAKPYNKIAEQNRHLAELNKLAMTQADKIQEVHIKTKLMMDATPICAMLWDENGNLFDCNEETVKIFKMKNKQDFIEQFYNLSPQYQPDGSLSCEQAPMYVNKAFDEGKCHLEWMHQLLDGTPVPCEMTLTRISHGDSYVVAVYARDLREEKQMMSETLRLQTELEAALKVAQDASQAKSSFLATMSHEIRTPLNAVVGLSELILDNDELSDEYQEMLEKIHTSGITILSIVNDILDISKVESGKFEINLVEYDTPSFINDTVTLNIVRIEEKPIEFKLIVDEKLPVKLYGDDLRLKQVFNNLLSNAFKYTNSGTVEWRLSYETEGDKVWLVSSIQDSGIGIKPEDIQKLFTSYNQVDVKTNRKVEGTGLGLVITKRLVEMMGGSINVESSYGKGTTFNVRLLQTLVSDTPIGQEVAEHLMGFRYTLSKRAKNAKILRVNLSYAHVLVVDDVATNLDVAKGMMKPYGMKVDCVFSGLQAIKKIQTESPRYNAIFMDHMMPEMDGIEATRVIREEIGTDYAKNIPIIALTANALVGNEELFLKNGFQAFISKPIDMLKLDSVLRRFVRDKDLEKENLAQENDRSHDNRDDFDRRQLPEDRSGEDTLLRGTPIAGLNLQKGLERFNNDEETIIGVLRSFATNTYPLLADLHKYLAAENLEEYAIIVHGIKGSSYGVFAEEVGRAAEMLETLAKAGDMDAVKVKHEPFVSLTKALLGDIERALAAIDATGCKPVAALPDSALLQELRKACEVFDMDRVDKAITKLESFQYESGEKTVAWLREQIDNMTFENIYSGEWPSE